MGNRKWKLKMGYLKFEMGNQMKNEELDLGNRKFEMTNRKWRMKNQKRVIGD